MQEILPLDSVVQDTYVDALTLGPVPGIVDGCDITIDRADVLMQFAVGGQGNNYWGDREYPMRPGTRRVDGVIGVRFRNKQAGAAAIANAALTDPNLPRLEPITPIAATGIGDVIISQQLPAAPASQTFGPFDVGAWPYLLLGLTSGNGGGSRLAARYPLIGQALGSVDQMLETRVIDGTFTGGIGGNWGLRVVPNLIRQVSLQVDQIGGVQTSIFAAPCAFPHSRLWTPLGFQPHPNLLFATPLGGTGIVATATQTYLLPPYEGVLSSTFTTSSGAGPYSFELLQLDYTGAQIARLGQLSAVGNSLTVSMECPGAPSPMVLLVTNASTTTNGAFTAAVYTKEFN